MEFLIGLTIGLLVPLAPELSSPEAPTREQIGEVLGKPVFRDQLGRAKSHEVRDAFLPPLLRALRKKHIEEVQPTKLEIEAILEEFNRNLEWDTNTGGAKLKARLETIEKELSAPGLDGALWVKLMSEKEAIEKEMVPLDAGLRLLAPIHISNWKMQRILYDEYGGGRVLYQQLGLEAFDATLKWLKESEKNGDFMIFDLKLHEAFYDYWKKSKSSGYLFIPDENIQDEFLQPAWSKKR